MCPHCLSYIIVAYAIVTQLKTISLRSMPLCKLLMSYCFFFDFLTSHVLHLQFCFNKSFPNEDDQNNYTTTRTVMFFICILYVSVSAFVGCRFLTPFCCRYIKNSFETTANFWNVISRSKKKASYMTKRGLSRYSSSLAYYCYIDCCSELLMDSFCLMVNLW